MVELIEVSVRGGDAAATAIYCRRLGLGSLSSVFVPLFFVVEAMRCFPPYS
jgi:hypothetical protein